MTGDEAHETIELERTTQLDLGRGTTGSPQLLLAFLAVAAASFLLGIGIATATRDTSGEQEGALIAAETIGRAGGTLRFEGGMLHIPRGALSGARRIEVRRSTVTERIRVGGATPVVVEPGDLDAYGFSPGDATFTRPVELTLRLPRDARSGTVFVRRGRSTVPLTGTIDAVRGTATVTLRDFRFGTGNG